jgi:DNA-binding NtrC family response regulator
MADLATPMLKTILYICDDSGLGPIRSRVLAKEGYDVILASAVQEGRKHWRERPASFDLVLFEISGDVRPALDLCEEIKADRVSQLYAVLASSRSYFSPGACPDGIVNRDDGPRSVVEQVNALLAEA